MCQLFKYLKVFNIFDIIRIETDGVRLEEFLVGGRLDSSLDGSLDDARRVAMEVVEGDGRHGSPDPAGHRLAQVAHKVGHAEQLGGFHRVVQGFAHVKVPIVTERRRMLNGYLGVKRPTLVPTVVWHDRMSRQ